LFSARFIELFVLSVIFNFKNIHPLDNFKGKHPFKSLCWNLNTNSDVNVVINHASYQSKKQQGKNYSSGFLRSFYLASLTSGYLWYSSFTAYAVNDNREKEHSIRGLFPYIYTELQALLISRPPLRLCKVRSCKVEILIRM